MVNVKTHRDYVLTKKEIDLCRQAHKWYNIETNYEVEHFVDLEKEIRILMGM